MIPQLEMADVYVGNCFLKPGLRERRQIGGMEKTIRSDRLQKTTRYSRAITQANSCAIKIVRYWKTSSRPRAGQQQIISW